MGRIPFFMAMTVLWLLTLRIGYSRYQWHTQYGRNAIIDKAVNIAELLDSNKIQVFYKWQYYTSRAETFSNYHIQRDSVYHIMFFEWNDDTVRMRVHGNINRENLLFRYFPLSVQLSKPIDSLKHWVSILSTSNGWTQINTNNTDTLHSHIFADDLFKDQNPVRFFLGLKRLKDSLQVYGISKYWISDSLNYSNKALEFRLSFEYRLTYIPDINMVDDIRSSIWKNDYTMIDTITDKWYLRKLRNPVYVDNN